MKVTMAVLFIFSCHFFMVMVMAVRVVLMVLLYAFLFRGIMVMVVAVRMVRMSLLRFSICSLYILLMMVVLVIMMIHIQGEIFIIDTMIRKKERRQEVSTTAINYNCIPDLSRPLCLPSSKLIFSIKVQICF